MRKKQIQNPMSGKLLLKGAIIAALWMSLCCYLCRKNGLGWGLTAFLTWNTLVLSILGRAISAIIYLMHEANKPLEEAFLDALRDRIKRKAAQ